MYAKSSRRATSVEFMECDLVAMSETCSLYDCVCVNGTTRPQCFVWSKSCNYRLMLYISLIIIIYCCEKQFIIQYWMKLILQSVYCVTRDHVVKALRVLWSRMH